MNVDNIPEGWSNKWPTEPGTYLFFGDFKSVHDENIKPEFYLVNARFSGNGHLIFTSGGLFIWKTEVVGIWKPFTETEPNWP